MRKKESQMSIIDTFIILSNSHHALCLLKIPYLIFQTCQFWDSTSNSNFPFQIALWYKKKISKRENKTTNTLVCFPLAASAVLNASSWVCRRLDINRRTTIIDHKCSTTQDCKSNISNFIFDLEIYFSVHLTVISFLAVELWFGHCVVFLDRTFLLSEYL